MADVREFDELDRRIVELMCRSSQGSYRQIAKQLGVHPTTLIQRVKNLEAKGVINGYRAKVDYMRLGFDYMGIIQVYVEKNMLDVQETIRSIPQVLAVFDVTGECDSIVWIACRDREEFSNIVKSILKIEGVQKTNTSVILNVMKDPSDFIPQVLAVFDVTGECDSIVWIACRDREEFSNIVKSILKIDGVQKTNTSVILNVMKDPADFIPQVLDEQ